LAYAYPSKLSRSFGIKNKGLAYAHPSKLRFEKRKREKKYSSKLGYFFSLFLFIRDPRRIRTFDLLLRRQLLYPAELWNQRSFYKKLIKKIVAGLF